MKNTILAVFLLLASFTLCTLGYPIVKWYDKYFEIPQGSMGDFGIIMALTVIVIGFGIGGLFTLVEKPLK